MTSNVLLRPTPDRPDRAEVEAAFRTIIEWTGDNPQRDGLVETPSRLARAFEEYFAGYGQNPIEILQKTFEEIEGYDEMIVLRGIRFESHCEHHMAPIIGQAWVALSRAVGSLASVSSPGQTSADSGEDDGADCQHNQRCSKASGCRRHYKGEASLYDDAWRA